MIGLALSPLSLGRDGTPPKPHRSVLGDRDSNDI